YHFPLTAWQRIQYTLDEGSFCELNAGLEPVNPLGFPGYDDKLARARKDSGLAEAVITGRGLIEGEPAYVGVLAPEFMLGSMGSVVGEKLARMLDEAGAQGVPAIIFSASGGARM